MGPRHTFGSVVGLRDNIVVDDLGKETGLESSKVSKIPCLSYILL